MKYHNPNALNTPYWICSACAEDRGGKYFKTASTCARMTCGYCNGEKQLENELIFPTVDYYWPK